MLAEFKGSDAPERRCAKRVNIGSCFSMTGQRPIEIEYRRCKLIAKQQDEGWRIEIRPLNSGPAADTAIHAQLNDAIDEANMILEYRGGRSKDLIRVKNRSHPAMQRGF